MPLYDYKCEDCGFSGEIRHAVNEKVKCPDCHGELTKVFKSAPPIHFNGTGFYVTDNSSAKKPT